MCKQYKIARSKAMEFIINRNKFTYDDLQKEIIDNGGVLRISNNHTLDHWLESFQQKGILRYSPADRTFTILVDFSNVDAE